jgi:hypothetical protein
MRYTTAQTRYKAQKENPDCFAFYKTTEGYACFYCWQTLQTYKNQR